MCERPYICKILTIIRILINKALGLKGVAADSATLDELTYLLESGSDRIGALDFQQSATE